MKLSPAPISLLALRLKEEMGVHEVGIRGAAKMIGCSPTTVSRMCRGEIPDVATIQKVCKWVNQDFIISAEEEEGK
jgi:transcriptional regulator with XRE-family HTH domain